VYGATCKVDSRAFTVPRATPVILALIVKRLTADAAKFSGDVVVLAAGEGGAIPSDFCAVSLRPGRPRLGSSCREGIPE
jgi:hypothetical protein